MLVMNANCSFLGTDQLVRIYNAWGGVTLWPDIGLLFRPQMIGVMTDDYGRNNNHQKETAVLRRKPAPPGFIAIRYLLIESLNHSICFAKCSLSSWLLGRTRKCFSFLLTVSECSLPRLQRPAVGVCP